MRILFDTNVLLDLLLVRDPHVREAALITEYVEAHRLTGVVAATTITTLSYFVERAYSATQAREDIQNLLKLFEVASVGRKVLEDALAMGFEDYEDAVLHEAARAGQADGIVTRNTKDFDRAVLAIYSPLELLHVLQAHI